jgi:hypothetical protein
VRLYYVAFVGSKRLSAKEQRRQMKTNYFTNDNTNGAYSAAELNEMNGALSAYLTRDEVDMDSNDVKSVIDYYAELIMQGGRI